MGMLSLGTIMLFPASLGLRHLGDCVGVSVHWTIKAKMWENLTKSHFSNLMKFLKFNHSE